MGRFENDIWIKIIGKNFFKTLYQKIWDNLNLQG